MTRTLALVCTLALAGCQPAAGPPKEIAQDPLGSQFDPKSVGAIHGRVTWDGPLPKIEPIKIPVATLDVAGDQPNPNAPKIDVKTTAIDGALVFLRTVDPAKSRRWTHDPVTVAFADKRLEIQQGKLPVRIGLVRRGDEIACLAHEKRNHTLEARGAAVFSLPLLEPEKVTRRKLEHAGILELASGSAYFWTRGHLWVGDHPYATLTDASGRFLLEQVPAGDYEVVCWLPNWRINHRERSPESGDIERIVFERGVEKSSKVTAAPGETAHLDSRWRSDDFGGK